MSTETMAPITPHELVTLDELSRRTKIPISTWRNWLHARKSPVLPMKINGHLRFRGRDVMRLLGVDGGGEVELPPRRRRGRPSKAEEMARMQHDHDKGES